MAAVFVRCRTTLCLRYATTTDSCFVSPSVNVSKSGVCENRRCRHEIKVNVCLMCWYDAYIYSGKFKGIPSLSRTPCSPQYGDLWSSSANSCCMCNSPSSGTPIPFKDWVPPPRFPMLLSACQITRLRWKQTGSEYPFAVNQARNQELVSTNVKV